MFCLPLVQFKTHQQQQHSTNMIILGGPLRRILPSSLHLALPANRSQQVRAAN